MLREGDRNRISMAPVYFHNVQATSRSPKIRKEVLLVVEYFRAEIHNTS
jgi:hypothetical protein